MVLSRSTGMTQYNYVGFKLKKSFPRFFVTAAIPMPPQPSHWEKPGDGNGYRTTPDIHIGATSLSDSYRAINKSVTIELSIPGGPTNAWYSFGDDMDKNDGRVIEGEYSGSRLPKSGYIVVSSEFNNRDNLNALYLEDNTDHDYADPPPGSDIDYELTSRSGWVDYAPNQAASVRIAKRICGNLNKISFSARGALTTTMSDNIVAT
jgi:hypothetical protein